MNSYTAACGDANAKRDREILLPIRSVVYSKKNWLHQGLFRFRPAEGQGQAQRQPEGDTHGRGEVVVCLGYPRGAQQD